MQDGLQRMELEAGGADLHGNAGNHPYQQAQEDRAVSLSSVEQPDARSQPPVDEADIKAYEHTESRAKNLETMTFDAPSFSPFPKVKGDNVPPGDDEKEEILWNARKHVLHSQNVNMQIIWARDVLAWAEVAMEAAAREEKPRSSTPRMEHELRVDARNIVAHLAEQDHPEALYMRSKWLEFGKFGNRVDKREAYVGYKRAAGLGHVRSEYRMGMLYEQSNDISKAKEHYYRGMNLGDSAALYRIGMMNLLGQHGETKDYPRALERIQQAANGADEDAPQGAYVYGMLVGRDLPDITIPEGLLANNFETAKVYLEKAAYLGFAKAQLKMGQAYELCQFACEFKPAYSLHYYGLAAKQGLPEAALGVSRWFLFGYEGVFEKNEELAFKYAHEAAAAKLPTGAFAMGYYYEIGIHVNKNISEAKKWYQTASDQGNKDAAERLSSLGHDQSLSKQDHETTTLTRIKSQHGSQRGQRPERFRQAQHMPTLDESASQSAYDAAVAPLKPLKTSPQPSPGMAPRDQGGYRDDPRPPYGGSDRQPAFNMRLDAGDNALPVRPRSAAPYPEDEGPRPLNIDRPRSAAPYPDDDVHKGPSPWQNANLRPLGGPVADRPGSAFGIKTQSSGAPQRPLPATQSMGNLQPGRGGGDPRGRVVSAGWEAQQQGGGRRPGPGQAPYPGNGGPQVRPVSSAPYLGDGSSRMAQTSKPLPPGPGMGRPPPQQAYGRIPPAGSDPRAASVPPQQGPGQGLGMRPQGHDTQGPSPGISSRPERLSSLPQGDHRHATAPPGGARPQGPPGAGPSRPAPGGAPGVAASRVASAPARPSKGPATFEDMGIPHGKAEGDCVSLKMTQVDLTRESRLTV